MTNMSGYLPFLRCRHQFNGSKQRAFSVVSVDCVASDRSHTHELGHNFGAGRLRYSFVRLCRIRGRMASRVCDKGNGHKWVHPTTSQMKVGVRRIYRLGHKWVQGTTKVGIYSRTYVGAGRDKSGRMITAVERGVCTNPRAGQKWVVC